MIETIRTAQDFGAAFAVSRETLARLEHYVAILERWNPKINLVSPSSLAQVWHRHIADSAQLWPLRPPRARTWADLGAGGGLPGLVIAILATEGAPTLQVHLVESDRRKCAFLRSVGRELNLPVTVHSGRLEQLRLAAVDIVSARALAPLPDLIAYARAIRHPSGTALFPKGAAVHKELDAARRVWDFESRLHPSRTEAGAAIVEIGLIHGPQ